jgi:hypothetical protein
MTRPYSISNPHPDHEPYVGRTETGPNTYGSGQGGRHYATTLSCSCGWTPNSKRLYSKGNENNYVTLRTDSKVSNEAPSNGGKAVADRAYRDHVDECMARLSKGWLQVNAHALAPGTRVMVDAFTHTVVSVGPVSDLRHTVWEIVTKDDEGTIYLQRRNPELLTFWLPPVLEGHRVEPTEDMEPWKAALIEQVNEHGGFVSEKQLAEATRLTLDPPREHLPNPVMHALGKAMQHPTPVRLNVRLTVDPDNRYHDAIEQLGDLLSALPVPHHERAGILRSIEVLRCAT